MADRALIAMSGGVDSSVAAKLMKERGMDCAGATMRLYDYETVGIADMTCCSAKDVEDARAVAERHEQQPPPEAGRRSRLRGQLPDGSRRKEIGLRD